MPLEPSHLPDLPSSRWLTSALVGFLFTMTGPVMVLLELARHLRLTDPEVETLLLVTCAIGGLMTIVVSWKRRQPLAFVWSLPAVAFLLNYDAIPLAALAGASLLSGVLLVVIGWRRLDEWLFRHVSIGVMFGMIAAVLAPFVTAIGVHAIDEFGVVAWMLAAFIVVGIVRRWRPAPPPLLVALITGLVVGPPPKMGDLAGHLIATPQLVVPSFSVSTVIGLVVPFVITVVAVQNAQGVSLLRLAGHRADESRITLVCGFSSIAQALGGCPPSSLAGPMQGILTADEHRSRQYRAAVVYGALYIAFGVFSPRILSVVASLPAAVVGVAAGLALLPTTYQSVTTAWRSGDRLGAILAFGITLTGRSYLGLPSAFWGILFGSLSTLLLSRLGRPDKEKQGPT